MVRLLRLLLVSTLLAVTLTTHNVHAAVWVAVSDGSKEYGEAAHVIRESLLLEGHIPGGVLIKPWQEISAGVPAEVNLLISVGSRAFAAASAAANSGKLGKTTVLAALIPQASFESSRRQFRSPPVAIFIEQPVSRQMALLRHAFGIHRVGILLGPATQHQAPAFSEAATKAGVRLRTYSVDNESRIYPQLQRLLEDNDVLLAIGDSLVYNGASIQNILLASYRQRVPLVGFSPAYVRAGAALALYSTPQQIGHQTARVARQILDGRTVATQQYPKEFTVGINADVSRSLSLHLNEAMLSNKIAAGEAP